MAVTITGNTRVIGQTTVGVVNPPLLDVYSGAAAAYSLRKLRTAYAGSAIRVRRSSDNTEQDIGFNSDGDLDIVSLLSFVGANNGFIRTWYDQSGNGNNATQITTANQPRIVNSGTIDRINNKPTIVFDGTNDHFTTSNISFSTYSIFSPSIATAPRPSGFDVSTIYCKGTTTLSNNSRDVLFFIDRTSGNVSLQRSDNTSFPTASKSIVGTILNLLTGIYTGTQLISYANGIAGTPVSTSITGTTSNPQIAIGATYAAGGVLYYLTGNITELIVYASDQSTNRTGIEQNINAYYNIY